MMILISLFLFQLPQDPEDMKHWMYNLYVEKEKMLERYYQTGQFPYDMYPPASTSAAAASAASNLQSRAPKMLYHDPLKFVVLHLFFLASTVVMIWTFLSLKSWNLFSMPSWWNGIAAYWKDLLMRKIRATFKDWLKCVQRKFFFQHCNVKFQKKLCVCLEIMLKTLAFYTAKKIFVNSSQFQNTQTPSHPFYPTTLVTLARSIPKT